MLRAQQLHPDCLCSPVERVGLSVSVLPKKEINGRTIDARGSKQPSDSIGSRPRVFLHDASILPAGTSILPCFEGIAPRLDALDQELSRV